MFGQNATIGRRLKLQKQSWDEPNIKGNPWLEKHVLYCDFDSPAVDETNDWAVNEAHGGTGAINAAAHGTYRLTTSTTDNDKCELARELCWYGQYACAIAARIKVDAITTVAINVGFSDAKAEADNLTAFRINGSTVEDTAADAVCWVFDTDATAAYWHYCQTKAGTQTGTSIVVAPVAATYEIFLIILNTDGDATFYRNGVRKGHVENAVTKTTALTPYVAVISRAGTAARNLDVDYLWLWQNRT